jgi:hypothetical protein
LVMLTLSVPAWIGHRHSKGLPVDWSQGAGLLRVALIAHILASYVSQLFVVTLFLVQDAELQKLTEAGTWIVIVLAPATFPMGVFETVPIWSINPQLHIPLFLAALCYLSAGAVAVVYMARRNRLKQRIKSGLCPNCGYDIRATPERCPECGGKIG